MYFILSIEINPERGLECLDLKNKKVNTYEEKEIYKLTDILNEGDNNNYNILLKRYQPDDLGLVEAGIDSFKRSGKNYIKLVIVYFYNEQKVNEPRLIDILQEVIRNGTILSYINKM